MREAVTRDRPTLWLDVAMLDKGFLCSSVLIDLLAFCSLFFWRNGQCFCVIFCVWENGRRRLHGMEFDTLEEEGEQGDARRRRFEAASLYMDEDKHPSGEALDVR